MTRYPRRAILKSVILILFFFLCDFAVYGTLKSGINKYYGFDKKAEILCVGHSHMVLGIDSERLEKAMGVQVAKYAIAGANTLDRFWMIKHYLSINPNVQAVIYDVDARLFDSEGLSSGSYTLFLPFIDNNVMSQYLKQETSWQEYYTSKLIRTTRFRDQTLNISLRGLLNHRENEKKGRFRVEQFRGYLERERKRKVHISSTNVECFLETLQLLSSMGIDIVLLHIPVVDLLNEIDQPSQEKVVHIFKEAARTNPNVHFLNYREDFQHDYALFFDLRHLNEKGKEAMTGRLIEDLRKLVRKNGLSRPPLVQIPHMEQLVQDSS